MDTAKEKVKKICDILRHETIEPAHAEAKEIVENAKRRAIGIIEDAKKHADEIMVHANKEIGEKKTAFSASMKQLYKQSIEEIKQECENKLFHPELKTLIDKEIKNPDTMAQIIKAVVRSIEKDGIDSELSVAISSGVPARSINALLGEVIVNKLKEKSVLLNPIGDGIEVKLHKENITIDVSEETLHELVSGYIRKDFRKLLFQGA